MQSRTHARYIILLPVYNDWEALALTLREVRQVFAAAQLDNPACIVVDDGSTQTPPTLPDLTMLHLHRNLGHQKAIATGLAYIHAHFSFERLVVMDADGEDLASHIPILLATSDQNPERIILARRTHRKEGISFQLLYRFYRLFFFVLTGRKIAFGNFCILSEPQLHQLVFYSEIWNSLAGAILKSGVAYTAVPTPKGRRHNGRSKMNLTSLIMHGLNTISVFIEAIAVRILILSFCMIMFSGAAILAVTAIRLFTPYAISGWASILASSLLVILLQSFLIALVMIVIFLSSQSQRKLIPAYHYTDYLKSTQHPADGA